MKNKVLNTNPTEEEILRGLREGKTYGQIGDEVGYPSSRIKQIKAKFIEEGKITQEEIDKAKLNQKDETKKMVLELMQAGRMYYEISKATGLSYSRLMEIKQELIQEGKLTLNGKNKMNNDLIDKKNRAIQISPSSSSKRKKDINREKNASAATSEKEVETYIRHCQNKIKKGEDIFEEIRKISQKISTNPNIATLEQIRFIALYYVKIQKPQMAIQFLQKCASLSKQDSERQKKLLEAREEVVMYKKRVDARRLIRMGGIPLKYIADQVGLGESEVIKIARLEDEKKKIKDENKKIER